MAEVLDTTTYYPFRVVKVPEAQVVVQTVTQLIDFAANPFTVGASDNQRIDLTLLPEGAFLLGGWMDIEAQEDGALTVSIGAGADPDGILEAIDLASAGPGLVAFDGALLETVFAADTDVYFVSTTNGQDGDAAQFRLIFRYVIDQRP